MKAGVFTILISASFLTAFAGDTTVVDSSALGRTVSVRGKLGQPLGKLITIEGTAVEHDYPRTKAENDAILMRVTKVEGAVLPQAVVISLSIRQSILRPFAPGITRTFRGYEDGGFTGVPAEANKILAVAATDWYFRTSFCVVK